jgi:hypothetical protein
MTLPDGTLEPIGESEDALAQPTAPTPQDYGFPANPSTVNKQCWVRQEAFLAAYGGLGTILHAARVAGIHRDTVNKWTSADLYSFKKRMEDAHQDYVESVERTMNDRLANPQGNRGSDVLLMFKLKAEAPEKYREEVKVVGVDASKQMMDGLRELAMKDRERAALEAPVIEGEFKEVGEPREEAEKPVLSPAEGPTRQGPSRPVRGTETPPVKMPQPPGARAGETNPSVKPPAAGRLKPGRYQQRREKPGRPFTRR